MPKRVISFKPTAECEVQLAELMGRWGCDRTAAIVRSVGNALRDGTQTLQVGTETIEAHDRLKRDKQRGLPKKVDPKVSSKPVVGIRSQQERMDDFYRANMAKGKK